MNTKKTMRVIAFILLVAMVILSLGGCGTREETPAEKVARYNEEKEKLKAKIEVTTCTTPDEFGDLMVEVSEIVLRNKELLGSRWVDPYVEMSGKNSYHEDGRCHDITLALNENESIMAYFKAPYTDKIPDLLHSKGLYAQDIMGLYENVANCDIDYYAVNGWYPLSGYAVSDKSISKDKIAEELKKDLRNPESLQIHEIKCFEKTEKMMSVSEVAKNKCRNLHVGCVIVDYSAQNGFGGYNRKKAWFDVCAYSESGYYLSLDTNDYRGESYPYGYSSSGGMYITPPDWE